MISVKSLSHFVTYITITCDITLIFLFKFKNKEREKKNQNKIKENEKKKIKLKGKYNRIQSSIYNFNIGKVSCKDHKRTQQEVSDILLFYLYK